MTAIQPLPTRDVPGGRPHPIHRPFAGIITTWDLVKGLADRRL